MTDHIERMVQAWYARIAAAPEGVSAQALQELVSAIHRMLREAENETRQRCEDLAVQVAGDEIGGRVALAIRTADPESLPRKSLTEIYAPELLRQ